MSVATAPLGLFDRSTKGAIIGPVTVSIERGRIAFFAQVLGFTDPIHFDPAAARAAGHPDVVAPPSFLVVVEAAANDELKRQGVATAAVRVGCDYRYLLHGEERYFYEAPIYAGEDVEVITEVRDFYDKKGGAMEFVELATTVRSAARGVLVRSSRALLHRLQEARP